MEWYQGTGTGFVTGSMDVEEVFFKKADADADPSKEAECNAALPAANTGVDELACMPFQMISSTCLLAG